MLAPRTLLELTLALVLGAAAGLLGSYAQQYVVGSARWPVGVLLALGLTAATAAAVRTSRTERWACVAAAVGWFAVVAAAASRRREGDLIVPGDGRGWAFLLGGALVLGIVIALPAPRAQAVVQ